MSGEEGAVDGFEEPEDGEVVMASEVDAEEEGVVGAVSEGEVDFPGGVMGVDVLVDEGGVDEEGIIVGGLAHVFLEEGFGVWARVFNKVKVVRLIHMLYRVIGIEFSFEL